MKRYSENSKHIQFNNNIVINVHQIQFQLSLFKILYILSTHAYFRNDSECENNKKQAESHDKHTQITWHKTSHNSHLINMNRVRREHCRRASKLYDNRISNLHKIVHCRLNARIYEISSALR